MSEIAFEHFDPELELGNLDINGKPIKPRKKPGRKPNPPSPAQRKAQNRQAQRAFRERKRREMRDAETNIKKCLNMRDQALKDAKTLQKKVDELIYENNFLKGQVLTFKIACMANRVDVPKFWDKGKRDKMGSDATTFSRTKDIPQPLEFFLDSKKRIVTMTFEELLATPGTPQQQNTSSAGSTMTQASQQQPLFDHDQTMIDSLLNTAPPPVSSHDPISPQSSSTVTHSIHGIPFGLDDISHVIQSAVIHSGMDPVLMQCLLQPETIKEFVNQMKDVPPELWLSQVPPEFAALIPQEIRMFLSQPATSHPQQQDFLPSPPPQQYQQSHSVSSPTPTDYSTTFQPEIPVEEDFWMDINKSPSTVSEKVYVAGPISPLDAVNQMRTMRDQNDNRFLLTPTELQRRIPHDPRIDLIPGPTMRDYMIIFQDYYDANELFNFLIESAMFIGGELGNPDCWFVPPNFITRYWFLCPNYRPTRPDNSVELAVFFANRMINLLRRRKEMYIMRDKHADQFLAPSTNEPIVNYDDMDEEEQHSVLENMRHSLDLLVIENINKDIPRIISPNAFTV